MFGVVHLNVVCYCWIMSLHVLSFICHQPDFQKYVSDIWNLLYCSCILSQNVQHVFAVSKLKWLDVIALIDAVSHFSNICIPPCWTRNNTASRHRHCSSVATWCRESRLQQICDALDLIAKLHEMDSCRGFFGHKDAWSQWGVSNQWLSHDSQWLFHNGPLAAKMVAHQERQVCRQPESQGSCGPQWHVIWIGYVQRSSLQQFCIMTDRRNAIFHSWPWRRGSGAAVEPIDRPSLWPLELRHDIQSAGTSELTSDSKWQCLVSVVCWWCDVLSNPGVPFGGVPQGGFHWISNGVLESCLIFLPQACDGSSIYSLDLVTWFGFKNILIMVRSWF